jgi:DNA-binding CsgD family transcriptional regulator
LVEVLGRYSKLCDQGKRIQDLLEIVPGEPFGVNVRTRRQVQHRLRPAEIEELVSSYLAGTKVKDVAVRHGINRSTVIRHINRAGVRRHYPTLSPEEVTEAAQLYRSGKSLLDVGAHFGVHASTVRTYLLKGGLEMRDCHGKKRSLDSAKSECRPGGWSSQWIDRDGSDGAGSSGGWDDRGSGGDDGGSGDH